MTNGKDSSIRDDLTRGISGRGSRAGPLQKSKMSNRKGRDSTDDRGSKVLTFVDMSHLNYLSRSQKHKSVLDFNKKPNLLSKKAIPDQAIIEDDNEEKDSNDDD